MVRDPCVCHCVSILTEILQPNVAISASLITTGPSSTAPPCSFPTSRKTKRSLATTYTINRLPPRIPFALGNYDIRLSPSSLSNQLYKYSYHIPINPTSEIGFRHHHFLVRTHRKFDMNLARCIYLFHCDSTEHSAPHQRALRKERA